MNKPVITPAANVRGTISPYTLEVLSDIGYKAGVEWMLVTSLERTPHEQANAMYENCEKTSPEQQERLYGPFGDQVIAAYRAGKSLNLPRLTVCDRMARKIVEIGPSRVSHHCADSKVMQVVDISPRSFNPQTALPKFIELVKSDHRISAVKTPADGDPALHCEVPQPQPKVA